MKISQMMKVWLGLALCLIGSMLLPVYGTENNESASMTIAAEAQEAKTPDADQGEDATPQSSKALTLVEQLRERMQQLDEREQAIQEDEQRLDALRRDLETLAQRHEKDIAMAVEAQKSQNTDTEGDPTKQSLDHLLKVYEAMDPDEAALRIAEMKPALALDILAGIRDKKAARVLAGVEPGKAAKLSEGLRYYKKDKGKNKP